MNNTMVNDKHAPVILAPGQYATGDGSLYLITITAHKRPVVRKVRNRFAKEDAIIDALPYNKTTKDAMKEAMRIAEDPNAPAFNSVKDAFASVV